MKDMFLENVFIKLNKKKLDFNIFYIGLFLLPSLPSISSIFLFISFIYLTLKKESYFEDKYNYPLILSSVLIIVSCILNTLFPANFYEGEYEIKQLWIGISNWLPYFWIFWLFQSYSKNPSMRKKLIIIFLIGSIPVIISGFLQYFFKFHGPFVFLNGFITWYSREIHPGDGMTGLFNNSNYLGMWLNIIWPFSIVFFKDSLRTQSKRSISSLLLASIFICTLLTFSRNSWLGLVLSTFLVLGFKSLKWLIPLLSLLITPVLIGLGIFPNNPLSDVTKKFIPGIIFHQFGGLGFENFSSFIRVQIWNSSINLISQRPLTGWGSSSFPKLFRSDLGEEFFHTHNLPLEIALSFGIPTAILIIILIIFILFYSRKRIFKFKNYDGYDKAWWVSATIVFFCHMFDLQFFDVRIGLIFWILLGGLRNILRENVKNKEL